MKKQATVQDIRNANRHVISVPYCKLQHALMYEAPYAYTAGRDGWHADIYSIGSNAIATGSQPFGDIEPPRDLLRRVDQRAIKLTEGIKSQEEKADILRGLLYEFVEQVIGE